VQISKNPYARDLRYTFKCEIPYKRMANNIDTLELEYTAWRQRMTIFLALSVYSSLQLSFHVPFHGGNVATT
jgi:hypothetical protein